MKLSEQQIEDMTPWIKEAFSSLFRMWDSLKEAENICDKEISCDALRNCSLSILFESELTDELIKNFIKEELFA